MVCAVVASLASGPTLHDAFDSAQAYAYMKQIVGFGERWPGSPGHQKTEDVILAVLARTGATIEA
ncbi:MAG TPA: hypothetical protein VIX35_12920, partial [Vicinamibacterales bacterium]